MPERACVVRQVLSPIVWTPGATLAAQLGDDALPHRAHLVAVALAGADPLTGEDLLDRLEEERGVGTAVLGC